MLQFVSVVAQPDIQTLVHLAEVIWREYYPALIGIAQVEYMLANFQSQTVIQAQLQQGYQYFLLQLGGEFVGYLAFILDQDDNSLQLSKFYLRADCRGQGLGRQAMQALENIATEANLALIELYVNKGNELALAAYQAMGFRMVAELVREIGGGYVMDDFKMRKTLSQTL